MDNLCHTLAGAALGEAGLKRTTGLGMATLLIGANLPDVDVLAIPFGHSLDFRRGWTHGVLAWVVLPLSLTALIVLWDRLARRRGRAHRAPVRPRLVLLLAVLSVWSHPLLDWLNSYGVRLLMPFSGRWFYGDALFIVDPWMWAMLAGGVFAARRAARPAPARLAIAAVTAYAALMVLGSAVGGALAAGAAEQSALRPALSRMAGPVPVNPLRREVVVREGDAYRFGSLRLLPRPALEMEAYRLPVNAADPAARAAAATPEGRQFLTWSRFPFFVVERSGGATRVRIDDARYSAGPQPSWAAVRVRVAETLAGTAP